MGHNVTSYVGFPCRLLVIRPFLHNYEFFYYLEFTEFLVFDVLQRPLE